MSSPNALRARSHRRRLRPSLGPGNDQFGPALDAFHREALQYLRDISNERVRKFAESCMFVLESRAKRLPLEKVGGSGVFEPDRKLIRWNLETIFQKYFCARTGRGNSTAASTAAANAATER